MGRQPGNAFFISICIFYRDLKKIFKWKWKKPLKTKAVDFVPYKSIAHENVSSRAETKLPPGGFTESSCTRLEGEARIDEMARLLSGLSSSESAREHANVLLNLAP